MAGKVHRHSVLVVAEGALPNGVSLLRLSVPARLLIAAVASALLWAAVLWALA
jgi:hypothetical protein